jgi:hypothetical protein
LSNSTNAPLALIMSCLADRFEIPGFDSLGEALIRKTDGGAAAVWAPVCPSYNRQNTFLDQALLQAVFAEQKERLGDAVLSALESYRTAGRLAYVGDGYALLGDPATVVGDPATLSGQASTVSFEDWRTAHFTPQQLQDPEISGPAADPDHDGLPNLMEYALNLDPLDGRHLQALRPGLIRFQGTDGENPEYFTVQFQRRRQADGLRYVIEVCDTLGQPVWRDGSQDLQELNSRTLDSLMEEVTARVRKQSSTVKAVFVRLRVERTE